MTRVVAMPLEDGETVLVEVGDTHTAGIERVGRAGESVRIAAETLEHAMSRARPAAAAVLASMRALPQPPSKIVVEFGIKLTAEAGVVIARVASEANFAITVEWSADRPTGPAPHPPGLNVTDTP
jgi:hypothetical protein